MGTVTSALWSGKANGEERLAFGFYAPVSSRKAYSMA